jgi:hypothetical protein
LRKVIAGLEDHVLQHCGKIESERAKPRPNDEWIASWQKEIEAAEQRIQRLRRRLRRE